VLNNLHCLYCEQVNDPDSKTAKENHQEKSEAEMDRTADDIVAVVPRTSTPDAQLSAAVDRGGLLADHGPRSPGACSRTSDDVSSIGSDDEQRKMTNNTDDKHGQSDEAAALDAALSTYAILNKKPSCR